MRAATRDDGNEHGRRTSFPRLRDRGTLTGRMRRSGRIDIDSELSGVPLFDGVSDVIRARIVASSRPVARNAGEAFFKEGDPADTFLVVISGRVKLTQVSPAGHQVVLRVLSAGQAFGAAGAFGDPTYPVNAEAVERTEALSWTSAAMRRFFETEPRIALNALQFVAGRLHDLQRRYRQLTTEAVDRRVARTLLRLIQEAGRQSDAGTEIAFPITRQDIAEMTGTTLYTASRLLSAWERQGILRSGRRRIVVLDPSALTAVVDATANG